MVAEETAARPLVLTQAPATLPFSQPAPPPASSKLGLRFPAAQGDASAQRILAYMHRKGEGGPRVDGVEARRLFTLAIAQGDAQAQRGLASMHVEGEDGPVDEVEARRLYTLAAAQKVMHRHSATLPTCTVKERVGQSTWWRRGGFSPSLLPKVMHMGLETESRA